MSYIIYRDSELLAAADASPYVDDTVAPGQHSYRVASVGENATQSDLSPAARIDVPAPNPLTVTVSLSNSRPTSLTIRVQSNPCMDTIRISVLEQGSAGAPDVTVLNLPSCVLSDSSQITGLRPNTTYIISVTAIGADGGTGAATPLVASTD